MNNTSTNTGFIPFLRQGLFILPLIVAIAVFEVPFYLSGESWPIDKVADFTDATPDVLYLPGIQSQQFNLYKFTMLKRRAPAIAVIGSSRVMKLRSKMFAPFDTTFYNAGGILQSLADLEQFGCLLRDGNLPLPSHLLVGIDPWWLKESGNQKEVSWLSDVKLRDNVYSIPKQVRAIIRTVKDFRRSYPALWKGAPLPTPHYAFAGVGLAATLRGYGFRYDGSVEYPPSNWKDVKRDSLLMSDEYRQRALDHDNQFLASDGLSEEKVNRLIKALLLLDSLKINTVVLFPPVSNAGNVL